MTAARRAWIPDAYDAAGDRERYDDYARRGYAPDYDDEDPRYGRRTRMERRWREPDDLSNVFRALTDIADRVTAAESAARAALSLADDRRPSRSRGWDDGRRYEPSQADLFAADQARRGFNDVVERARRDGMRAEDQDRLAAVTAAFSTLDRRMDEILRKLDSRSAEAAARHEDAELLDQIRGRLDAIVQRVDTPRPADRQIESTLRGLEDRLSDLMRRIETPPAEPPVRDERLARIEAQLSGLAEHLARPTPEVRPATFHDQLEWDRDAATGGGDLASAIRQIMERQKQIEAEAPAAMSQAMDERFREFADTISRRITDTSAKQSIGELQSEVRKLSSAVEASQRQPDHAPEIRALREQVLGLHRTLETAVSKTSLSAIVDEVRAVGEKIEVMRRSGVAAPELKAIETEIGAIRRAVETAAPKETFETLQAQIAAVVRRLDTRADTVDPETLQRLAGQIAEVKKHIADVMPHDAFRAVVEEVRALDRRISEIKPVSDAKAIEALRQEIAQLRSQMGQGTGSQAGIEDLKSRIERMMSAVTEAPAIRSLEARVGELTERVLSAPRTSISDEILHEIRARIDEATRQLKAPSASVDFSSLELQINALASKFDQIRSQDPGNGAVLQIGQQIKVLSDSLSSSREQAIDVARQAAADAVRQALSDLKALNAPGDRAVVDALQKNLSELRNATDASERRTQETLLAVHDTLRKVVERLASGEAPRGAPAPMPVAPQPAPAAPSAKLTAELPRTETAAPLPTGSSAASEPARDAMAAVAAAREAAAKAATLKADPSSRLTPDLPLEPGSGRPRQPMTAADAVRAAREQIKAAEAAKAPEEDVRQSFITAARRAVQAAADARAKSSDKSAAKTAKAEAKAAKAEAKAAAKAAKAEVKGPVWTAVGKPLAGDPPSEATTVKRGFLSRLGSLPEGRRKQLVMAMAAIVIVLGALQVVSGFLQSEPPTTPVAQSEQTAPQASQQAGTADTPAALSAPIDPPRPFTTPVEPPRETTAFAAPTPPGAAAPTARAPAGSTITLPPIPDGVAGPRLTAAAQSGDARALFEIGNRMAEGRGMQRDLAGAIAWWRLGDERSHAPSIYRLANAYEKGHGVARDSREAMRLYQRAADLGSRKAMHNLAALLASGADGNRADYDRAFPLFQRAAELGLVDSQYNLAVLLVNGLGTRQNMAEAYTWFHIAAQNGDGEAGNRRDEVARRLDSAGLVNARMAAQNFRPRPFDPAANEEVVPADAFDEPPARTSRAPVNARPNLGIQVGATQPGRS